MTGCGSCPGPSASDGGHDRQDREHSDQAAGHRETGAGGAVALHRGGAENRSLRDTRSSVTVNVSQPASPTAATDQAKLAITCPQKPGKRLASAHSSLAVLMLSSQSFHTSLTGGIHENGSTSAAIEITPATTAAATRITTMTPHNPTLLVVGSRSCRAMNRRSVKFPDGRSPMHR